MKSRGKRTVARLAAKLRSGQPGKDESDSVGSAKNKLRKRGCSVLFRARVCVCVCVCVCVYFYFCELEDACDAAAASTDDGKVVRVVKIKVLKSFDYE